MHGLREVGYWSADVGSADSSRPHPSRFIDASWHREHADDAAAVVQYLRCGMLESYELGYSTCRLCGVSGKAMGCCALTDGVFVWPEGLAHYVESHDGATLRR
jgi:hypothetical protein